MNRKLFQMRRREFLKGCAAAAASSTVPGFWWSPVMAQAASPATRQATEALALVKPMIGTGWHGHMFPGATLPFGLVQLSPDSSGLPRPKWRGVWDITEWDHCSGYHYSDNVIVGFSHTHVQGTGAPDLGDVLLMPLVEGRNWSWQPGTPGEEADTQIMAIGPESGWVFNQAENGYRSFFSHDKEDARAGFYGVHLETPDVHAELTATTRCGMHRYTFPKLPSGTKKGLILDLFHSLRSKVYAAELRIESPTRISGQRSTHGWAKDRQVYFVLELQRPPSRIEITVDGQTKTGATGDQFSGKDIKAIFTESPGDEPLLVRVGISGTSVAGAAKNLAAEIHGWDFEALAHQAGEAWAKALSTIEADLNGDDLKQTFSTGSYHGLVAPATFNDVDGTYRGQDHRNHPNPGFTKYTTISIWDIYRGEFPYLMLTEPDRINDMVRTLMIDYQQLNQHSLPMWPLWANETWAMTGFHVVGMIAGAYVRGFRDYDVDAVYAAMRDTAMVGATENGNQQLQEQFRRLGYVTSGPHRQSVSRTLDFSYDYWSIGAMAKLLGKHEDAAMFLKLGQNYKNIFDPVTGFMRGKTEDGKWREPFQPDNANTADYTESDAWQATFNVMQDVSGLIGLYGGDEQFIAKLDALFAAPSNIIDSPPDISGMVGQDAQGNEPSNHIPYLYAFAGAPWKTQKWVRKVAELYNNTPAGVPGNDDCGQTSTWFDFAALGFYPVNAVTGVYVLGSPMVNRAIIRNRVAGTTFTIVTENNSDHNIYIESVELNGRPLTRSWITHKDILAGGELRFRMSSTPNKQWAQAPEDRPPSGLIED